MNQSSLIVTPLRVGQMATNCYLLTDKESAKTLIVDPGDDPEYIMDHISELSTDPIAMIATHGHFDHIMAATALKLAYNIPFFINSADIFLVDRMQETAKHFLGLKQIDPAPGVTPLSVSEPFFVGGCSLKIFSIPGHTPGSICLYDAKGGRAFVGDTLFANIAFGRTDFSKIPPFPSGTTLYPGHGEKTLVP